MTITITHSLPHSHTDAAILSSHLDTDTTDDVSTSFSSYATSSAVLRATTVQTVALPGRLHQVACSKISASSSRGKSCLLSLTHSLSSATVCVVCGHDITFLEMSVSNQSEGQQLLSVLATHHSTTAISSVAVRSVSLCVYLNYSQSL